MAAKPKKDAAIRVEQLAENVVLYCGDCADVLPTLSRVDAVITDPPYGIAATWKGGSGSGWGNARAETDARNEWDDKPPSKELMKLISSKGHELIFWGGNYYELPPTRCWLVWNKPERNFSLAEAELAWTNMDTVVRVWDGPRSEPDREHPTQKPVRLMQWCILQLRGEAKVKTILDCFMGSGTTGVAATSLGHKFIGIERDPRWFDLACKRIKKELSQDKLF